MHGCHSDNDKENNNLSNLRWDTPKGNIADLEPRIGQLNGNAKLLDSQLLEIKNAVGTLNSIATQYSISPSRVWQIKTDYKKARS